MCARMAGILSPSVPHMPSVPTLPRSCKSSITSATTPVFLSDLDAPSTVYPVVYSPVPIMSTAGGLAKVESAIEAINSPRVHRRLCDRLCPPYRIPEAIS